MSKRALLLAAMFPLSALGGGCDGPSDPQSDGSVSGDAECPDPSGRDGGPGRDAGPGRDGGMRDGGPERDADTERRDGGPPSTAGLCRSDAECDDDRRCTSGDPGVCLRPPGCDRPGDCPDVCYGACVYLGALELAFSPGPRLTASSYENFFGVLLADFTGDGHADVLLTDHTGGDENHYWSGDGLGTFTPLDREAHGVGQEGTFARGSLWVTLLDLDQDGRLDWYWDDVSPPSLRRNTGGGVFEELAATSWTSGRIRGFYLRPGTSVMSFVTSEGLVVRGEALISGSISSVTPSSTPATHTDVLATVDCDPVGYSGEPICATHLGAAESERGRFKVPSVVLADLNGDGITDLVASYGESFSPSTEPRVYRGAGDGTYALEVTLPARLMGSYADYSNIVAADFDNDGLLDLALAGVSVPGQPGVRTAIYQNHGGFTFAYAAGFSEGASGGGGKDSVAAGDYDNDGRIDVALISGNGVQLHRNTSTPVD